MAKQKAKRQLAKRVLISIIAVFAAWAALYAGRKYLHGDSAAPFYVVPDAWRAALTIADDKCDVALEYHVDVLKTDSKMKPVVPLFPEGTVFTEIRLNDDAIVPVKHGGWVCAEIDRPGDYLVACEVDVKISDTNGVKSCSLKKADFVSSTVTIDAERPLEVRIQGTPQVVTGTKEGGTHGLLHAGLIQDVTITWEQARPKSSREGSVRVRPSVVWTVKEKVLAASAIFDVSISGGTRDRLVLGVPEGIGRVVVPVGAVAHWALKDNLLTLFFGRQVGGDMKIELGCEVARKDSERASCPAFRIEKGHLASGGYIVVVNDTPGIMLETSRKGLEPVADIDLPADLRGKVKGKPLFVYREASRASEPVYDVVTKKLFPMVDTIADRAEILTVVYGGGEEITRIVYAVRNNGRQFLRMAMPEGCEILLASVDNTHCSASTKDGLLLLPLADSIQTLGGLVPFPVEIVYCRKAEKPLAGNRTKIDLPELPDVPVAAVRAKVFYPDDLTVSDYRSSLADSDMDGWHGELSVWGGLMANGAGADQTVEDLWLHNAYWAGYRAYRENRVEDAEELLSKIVNSSRDKQDIGVISEDLLKNIKAGRGEVKGRDKLEKAKISAIQGSLATMNEQLEAQQSQLIQVGLANLDSGDEEVGAELLKEADKVGALLGNRGGSTLRQSAVRKKYAGKLKAVEDERRRKRELESNLKRLQMEARELTAQKPEQARKLGKGLVKAACEEKLAPEQVELSDIAWGQVADKQELSAGVEAQAVMQAGVAPGNPPAFAVQREGKGLKESNQELGRKVSVLEKAISFARSAAGGEVSWDYDDTAYIKKSIEKKKESLSGLKERLSGGRSRSMAANDYYQSRKDLDELKAQVTANKASFQGVGTELDRDLNSLEREIAEIEKEMSEQGQVMRSNEHVALAVTNALAGASFNTLQSFSDYINWNYVPADDAGQVELQGDTLQVANSPEQVERISQVIEKFADNRGNAVRFGARRVDLDVGSLPELQGWFTNSAANGNTYAILDEAQYNTLLQTEALNTPEQPDVQLDERDIIVGTPNDVLGKEVTLSMADAGRNGIKVDGSEVVLGHDEYYAVAEGDGVTVIKAGAARNWQEEADDVGLDVQMPFRIDLPERGRAMCFEKTLLSAGESPDIELMFEG